MKPHIFMLLIGIALGVVVTLPLTVVAGSDAVTKLTGAAQTQEKTPQPGQTHQRMHEQCAKHMEGMGGSGMGGMMGMMMNGSMQQEMMQDAPSPGER
jgi:hypothetical protein